MIETLIAFASAAGLSRARTAYDAASVILRRLGLLNTRPDRRDTAVFLYIGISIFTALHGMQRGLNDEISVRLSVRPSVCLSVRLSVKRVHCDKTEERYVLIFISHERTFILVL